MTSKCLNHRLSFSYKLKRGYDISHKAYRNVRVLPVLPVKCKLIIIKSKFTDTHTSANVLFCVMNGSVCDLTAVEGYLAQYWSAYAGDVVLHLQDCSAFYVLIQTSTENPNSHMRKVGNGRSFV